MRLRRRLVAEVEGLGVELLGEVAHRIRMKYAAKLKFLADESFDEADRIERLLSDPKVARDLDED